MLVTDITQLLPATLEWMVLFNLDKLHTLFDPPTIKRMFELPVDITLDRFSHTILTSEGTRLAPNDGAALFNPQDGGAQPHFTSEASFGDRFASQLSHFPLDEADCLGVGELAPFFPPVVLFLKIQSNVGFASALFFHQPSQLNYELLQAVGVQFISGEWQNEDYLAHFCVDLNKHILAGILSNFSKTGYCNAFFLQHGTIGPTLEAGLVEAARHQIGRARDIGSKAVERLSRSAAQEPLWMLCQPPPPKQAFPFGDLVPIGFLLRALALHSNPEEVAIRKRLEGQLLEKRRQGLWSFQSGDINTSTDSALILLGVHLPEAVQALEIFSDGNGGYYPQLWSETNEDGKMPAADLNRHWLQADQATTYLARALRREAGLPELTSIDYLCSTFNARSGLYFANPYLVDWTLALALQGDDSARAEALREELLQEILASSNKDHTFGKFDVALSTAFAILSLAAIGYRGRTLLLSQMRLAEFMEDDGTWPVSTPFYSTFKLPDLPISQKNQESSLVDAGDQIVQVHNQLFAISYYIDQYKIISTAVAALALAEEHRTKEEIPATASQNHPRYICQNQAEYIQAFALPAYIQDSERI
jgi:hypothetical protein